MEKKCKGCPWEADCMLMEALIKMSEDYDKYWKKVVEPSLKKAELLIVESKDAYRT